MKHVKLFFALFAMLALGVTNAWGANDVVFSETFGAGTTSNTAYSSFANYTATTEMFTDGKEVKSHYSGSGKVGKNNLSGVNLSSGYDGVSGGSGCYHGGTANTQATIISISNIDIQNYTDLTLSFGALGGSTSHKIDVTYSIDGGAEKTLISLGSITNQKWTLLSANIAESGASLTLYFKHKPTKTWTVRLDDFKITGVLSSGSGSEETVDSPVFSSTEANFTEAFNLTITSAEGTTLKYTTDKTDPTTSATAVVVENNTATVAIPAKSTMVKAIAVKGELVSNVKSMTYCYINSAETAYTVTEALEVYNAGLGLDNSLYIQGTVESITEMNTTQYYNANYTITDGENDLYIFRGKGIDGANFTSESQLLVGDELVIYGKLSEHQGIPQVAQDSKIISRVSTTKAIIVENLTFDAIALGAEVEAQTLAVTGANLTAEITATLDNEKFTVAPATLPAAGGDLTITPAADLAVGEHTATLTLTSGETVKEVALSILVKDIYSINWSVNGTIANETKVVAGDKLVLPVAPDAPDACSEKVFVGWATTSTVNADGSEIEYVTSATVPTESTTYYAVFAVQEGEGTLQEGKVTLAYAGGTTGNLTTGNNASTVGLDANLWNVAANKGSASNNVGVNKDNDIRLYWHAEGSNTLTVTSLVDGLTITTILITYTGDSYSNAGVLVNSAAVSGDGGSFTINANSFTITNNNTSSAQVRIKKVDINYTSGTAATYTNYSTTCDGTSTDIENIAVEGKAVKAIINGQLVIVKDGVKFNALGQVIK